MTNTFTVQGMHCSSCVMNIEEALLDVPGVTDAEASLKSGKVSVTHDGSVPEATIRAAVAEAGYELAPA